MRGAARRQFARHMAWRRHERADLARRATGCPGRQFNRVEARLAELLDGWGVDYRWQFRLGRYVFDFLLPGRVLVEVHGTYWHADPRVYPPDRLTPDQRRNVVHDLDKRRFAARSGYRVRVVWEADILAGGVSEADLLGAAGRPGPAGPAD